MRKVMWFSVGFATACALAVYVLSLSWLIPFGMLGLAFGTAALLCRAKPFRIPGMILLGLALGLLWFRGYDALVLAPVRALDGQEHSLTLTASDYSWKTEYGICVDGTAELEGGKIKIRMYLNQRETLEPGDRVTGTFRLRYTAPGGQEDATHHSGKGILLLAYPREDGVIEKGEGEWYYFPARFARKTEDQIRKLFPKDTVPFLLALLLGNTSELDYKTETALSLSGLRHVAAVSGLHVSMLFSVVYFFTRRNRFLSILVGTPVLLIFAAMAGFSPSILRAAIMQFLLLLSFVLRREYDPPTSLGTAALVMLAANPLVVTSTAFQLSVASVAGIFLVSGRIQAWLMDPKRLGRWKKKRKLHRLASAFSVSVSISLGALVMTTPLCAWYFRTVSLLSVATNLLCLWAVTLLFCGSICVCVLGAIWLPAGKVLGWCFGWIVRYVLGTAGLVARFPLSALYMESPYAAAWLIFFYMLLVVFLFGKKRRPGVLLGCAALSLCLAVLMSWTEPLLDSYRVTVLDVGQGQCVLLQSGGRTYMVDCGGEYEEDTADTAAERLLSQGITRLDGLILTHYDWDHVGAAAYLLQRIPADVLILPDSPGKTGVEPPLLEAHEGQLYRCLRDTEIQWKDASITIFASDNFVSSNESSICVLFHTEKCDILITGDRSAYGEAKLLDKLPRLDALVAGHHGAAGSTGEALLAATEPETVLISVGEDNSYGHPSPKTLARLEAWGCTVRRTDLEGTILLRG